MFIIIGKKYWIESKVQTENCCLFLSIAGPQRSPHAVLKGHVPSRNSILGLLNGSATGRKKQERSSLIAERPSVSGNSTGNVIELMEMSIRLIS